MVMTPSTTSTSICSTTVIAMLMNELAWWRTSVAPVSVRSSPKPDDESSEHFRRLSDRVDALQAMSLTTVSTLGEAVQAVVDACCSTFEK